MSTTPFTSLNPRSSSRTSGALLTKVPEIIAFFWITKVATTAMGETTSDCLNGVLGPAIAVPLMLIGLVWTLRRQFRAERYSAWTYWGVVVMVAIFGTSAADALHVVAGVPYRRRRRSSTRSSSPSSSSPGTAARGRFRSTRSTPDAARPSTGRPSSPPSRSAPRPAT